MTNEFLKYMFEKKMGKRPPTSHNIGFSIAPLFNSVCRSTDQEAKQLLFSCLVGEGEAKDGIKTSVRCHRIQKENISNIYLELLEQVDDSHKAIVVYGKKEQAEYNGLAANMLCSKFNKPVLVLRELNPTTWTGSVRSKVPTMEAINATGMATCAGHSKAHGITIHKALLPNLIRWFDGQDLDAESVTEVVAEVKDLDITLEFCEEFESKQMAWGAEIPEPLFYCKFVSRAIDRHIYTKKSNTIRFDIEENDTALLLFKASEAVTKDMDSKTDYIVECTFVPAINEYLGTRYGQGVIAQMTYTPIARKHIDIDDIL